MGHQCIGYYGEDTEGGACRDSCEPNPGLGMVQPQASESMEANFSVDQSGCKGGRTSIVGSRVEGSEQSMVGVSIGFADAGGGLAFGIGIHTSNFISSDVVRSESHRDSVRAKNVGGKTNFHLPHREQPHNQNNTSLSGHVGFRSLCLVTENGDGSPIAQSDTVSWRRANKGNAEATGWNLRKVAKSLPLVDECPTPEHIFLINIIVWNYRGVLKPTFKSHVRELVCNQYPAILIVMETQIGGDRAKEITALFFLMEPYIQTPLVMRVDCGFSGMKME